MGQIEIEALERFYAADFSASVAENGETDLFRAGLIHPLPTELASVGGTRLRGQGVDKSGVVTLTKSGWTCPLDFGAKTQGAMGCVAYHLENPCQYVLGYVVNGAEKLIVLEEFQRRLASGQSQWLIVDVVEVPAEFSGRLEFNNCRYGGAMMQPIIAAMSATGEPGDWVGPADWVVVVDWEQKKLISGDPRLVECWVHDF